MNSIRSEYTQLKDFQTSLTEKEKVFAKVYRNGLLQTIPLNIRVSSRESINLAVISFIEGMRFAEKIIQRREQDEQSNY